MFRNRYSLFSLVYLLMWTLSWSCASEFENLLFSQKALFDDVEKVEILVKQYAPKSCEIETFLAHWLYYHETWSQAQEYNEGLVNNSVCELYYPDAYILKAKLLQKKQQWNQGLLSLYPLITQRDPVFYQRALAIAESLLKARIRSVYDVSPQEESWIEEVKQILHKAQEQRSQEELDFLIVTDSPLSQDEQSAILNHFVQQPAVKTIKILLRDEISEQDIVPMSKGRYILSLYLKKPLEEKWFAESKCTLQTQPQFFKKQRKNDFLFANLTWSFLFNLLEVTSPISPEYILYNHHELSSDVVTFLERLPQAYRLDLNASDLGLGGLLRQPQRASLFGKILPSSLYIPQPALLPYGVAFLGGPESSQSVYDYLSQFYSKNIFFSLYAPGQKRKQMPALYLSTSSGQLEHKEFIDLLNILSSVLRFAQNPLGFYQGELGLYLAQEQVIFIKNEWRSFATLNSVSGNDLKLEEIVK